MEVIFINLVALSCRVVLVGTASLVRGDAGCCLCGVDEEVLCGVLYGVVDDEAHHPGEKDVPRDSVIYAVVQVIGAGLKFGIVLWPKIFLKLVILNLIQRPETYSAQLL